MNRDHLRDRSKGIEELKQQVLTYFEDREVASDYLGELVVNKGSSRSSSIARDHSDGRGELQDEKSFDHLRDGKRKTFNHWKLLRRNHRGLTF